MISGKLPFALNSNEMSDKDYFLNLRTKILNNKPNEIHKFSPPLRDFIMKLLEKDPK